MHVFTGYMEDTAATNYVKKVLKIQKKSEVAVNLLTDTYELPKKTLHSVYSIDCDELIEAAFKKSLNTTDDVEMTQLGYVWVKLPTLHRWKRFHARIKDGAILFCKNV